MGKYCNCAENRFRFATSGTGFSSHDCIDAATDAPVLTRCRAFAGFTLNADVAEVADGGTTDPAACDGSPPANASFAHNTPSTMSRTARQLAFFGSWRTARTSVVDHREFVLLVRGIRLRPALRFTAPSN